MDIVSLPFNQLVGITHSGNKGSVLSLPNDLRYTNHLGTVHAAALLALAEATSGEYLIRELKSIGFEVVPVVRRLEAKFRKPAVGAVFSKS
jgi:acyl-coenzyme A thioesterase PaaI-like protein